MRNMEKQDHRPQCAESLNPPPIDIPPPIWSSPHFYLFFQTPRFWQDFFNNIIPMKYWIDTEINSRGKVKKVTVKINILNERLAE